MLRGTAANRTNSLPTALAGYFAAKRGFRDEGYPKADLDLGRLPLRRTLVAAIRRLRRRLPWRFACNVPFAVRTGSPEPMVAARAITR